MISLSDLTKRPDAPLSERQLKQLDKWLKEDWEAADIDRTVKNIIKRLLITIENGIDHER